jgi:hypothetical protein
MLLQKAQLKKKQEAEALIKPSSNVVSQTIDSYYIPATYYFTIVLINRRKLTINR